MGVCWSSFRFVNKLKQPYRCIVKCGSNVFKVAIAIAILGFIFLYFFWLELHGNSLWKRALAVTGIVLSSISFVLFIFSCTICVFYLRLYKGNERDLNEISLDGEKQKDFSDRISQNPRANGNLLTRNKLPVWSTGNSTYLYAPSAPPLSRMTPPPQPYNLPNWSTANRSTKSLSVDRNVVGDSNSEAEKSLEKKKQKTKLKMRI